MNIGIVTSGLFPVKIGGLEKQSFELATWLSKSHVVIVYVRYHKNYNDLNYSELGAKIDLGKIDFDFGFLQEKKHIGNQEYFKTNQ